MFLNKCKLQADFLFKPIINEYSFNSIMLLLSDAGKSRDSKNAQNAAFSSTSDTMEIAILFYGHTHLKFKASKLTNFYYQVLPSTYRLKYE